MADNRKEQERAELHRTIWGIANDLRGSVDGWDFKQYVLGMLFYRYISENLTNYINQNEREAGDAGFDYAQLSDEQVEAEREDLVRTKGYLILPSQLFENVRKRAPRDENLNETLEAIFRRIESSARQVVSGWQYVSSWYGSETGGMPVIVTGAASVGSGTYKLVIRGNVSNLEYPTASVTKTN